MASGQWAVVLRHVQRLFQSGTIAGLSEGQLLDRFVSHRDEMAFGAIIARHGPMVLGVCRGVLRQPEDIDDAFQATFLILVKKAQGLRDRDLLGPWLYGVARRVSLRTRAESARRQRFENREPAEPALPDPDLDHELRELQSLIREEVDRLSTQNRMAVVLCYLEGLTHEEAADRLGWPVGTVKGRLSRARAQLRDRLARRGVALPAVFASDLARSLPNLVPRSLIQATTLAATRLLTSSTLTAGVVSAHTTLLVEGVIGTMFPTQLKIAATAVAATCILAIPGVLAYQGATSRPEPTFLPQPVLVPVAEAGKPTPTVASKPAAAQPGDDSKPETVAGLCERIVKSLEQLIASGEAPRSSPEQLYLWSKRLAEARAEATLNPADRKVPIQAHYDRMKLAYDTAKASTEVGSSAEIEILEARFRLVEAARWVREGRIGGVPIVPPLPSQTREAPGPPTNGQSPPRAFLVIASNPADDQQNEAIRAKLEERIPMKFATETPLSDLKKYLQDATIDPKAGLPSGIPIYIDPLGLQDSDKTLASTFVIDLEGIPLRTTLKLALRQLNLIYRVEGGLLLIEDMFMGNPAEDGNE